MRTLNKKEQRSISGGFLQNRTAMNPMEGPPTRMPPPPDSGPRDWTYTNVYNNLGEIDGQNVDMGDAGDLITTTQSDTFKTSFGDVDYQLMHELGTSNNSMQATTDINGSNVIVTAGYDTENGLFGSVGVSYNGSSATLGINSSGDIVGGGSFNVDGFTGNASVDLSTGTLSFSGSGIDFGSVQCSFDIFGLGSGGGGGGSILCTGHPTDEVEVVGVHGADSAHSSQQTSHVQHVETA